jgi:AcrR family transcriptional regulator
LVDQRMAEILDSARRAFAEKGFDGASMQDLARKAGMSVGNFYRYFPSKDAIVEALISSDIAEMQDVFSEIVQAEHPFAALRAALALRISEDKCSSDGQLWAEITAAALRKPDIGFIACRMEDVVIGHLTEIFARVTNVPLDEARLRWSSHAELIMMLVKGSAMQRRDGDSSENLTALILRTVDRTLDEISRSVVKG